LSQILAFLHTSPVHVATFNRLIQDLDPTIEVRHVVNESLLRETQPDGEISPELAGKINDIILGELANNARVVLCTCSTIGPVAEQINPKVVRVDRPMAEQAVTAGKRIVVLAALTTTLAPTRQLILDAAGKADQTVEIIEIFCETAWPKFEQGDRTGYLRDIAKYIDQAADKGDVIVLAQASMAGAAQYCEQTTVPVLSSPQPGLEAAIRLFHRG
jgi:hypothetical protein